jgi:ssDNA thymidine ADP-ribosyltransferase, DarT
MNTAIAAEVAARQITRLCHFTPMINLVHIATGEGLASTQALEAQERAAYTKQDLERFDGFPDHICCSIQYPNAWYFRSRMAHPRSEDRLFRDWVVLEIEPELLAADGTLFCPRNAAAKGGRYVRAGTEAFRSLFADAVVGARGRMIGRDRKPRSCPTDDQAEVLLHSAVPLECIHGIVVRDVAQAKRTYVALRNIGAAMERFSFSVAPDLFDARALSESIRAGQVPVETPWDPTMAEAS